MSDALLDMIDAMDIDSKLDELFRTSSNIKTEVSVVTYDVNDNKLQSDNSEYTLKLSRESIDDEKQMNKFIKKCESMIRMCPEYGDWADYIRDVMDMTECQISGEEHHQAKSDIHHHPINLYTCVKGVIMKRIASGNEFNSIDVSKEVMEMHYKMQIPFIVLLKSLHEKFHNGFINLPIELCQGDLNYFIQNYGPYLSSEDLEPILEKLKINWSNCGYDKFQYSWKKKINKDLIDE